MKVSQGTLRVQTSTAISVGKTGLLLVSVLVNRRGDCSQLLIRGGIN